MVAGAEGQRGLDLDAELVRRHAGAVVLAVHDEAPGGDGDEVLEAGLDPVLGLDGVEGNGLGEVFAGRIGDELAHQRLVRRIGKMRGDFPAPVRPLERGNRRLALEEYLGQRVDQPPGGLLVGKREAGAMGRFR